MLTHSEVCSPVNLSRTGRVTFCRREPHVNECHGIKLYFGINETREETKMSRTSNLTPAIVALLVISRLGTAQVVQKRPTQEAPRIAPATKVTRQEAAASTPLDTGSREYRQIVA